MIYTFLISARQIAHIETQLQAHIARTSHIQNRLLSTLDTLDAVQAAHVIELEAETSAKERLSQKLDRYLDFVQTAEKEKDDLRDAVIQLVKKGVFGFLACRLAVLVLVSAGTHNRHCMIL